MRHQRVQRLRRLLQRRSARLTDGVFVTEGVKLLDCALDAHVAVESVYVGADALGSPGVRSVQRAMEAGARGFSVGTGVLERVAVIVTQPVLAVVRTPEATLDDVAAADLVVVCVDVRDPGNAGALIRSADAAGAGGVVFCDMDGGPVQPQDSTGVRRLCSPCRSSQGFRQTRPSGGWPNTDSRCGGRSQKVEFLIQTSTGRRSALVLGNEATGLEDVIKARLDELVTVPDVRQSRIIECRHCRSCHLLRGSAATFYACRDRGGADV